MIEGYVAIPLRPTDLVERGLFALQSRQINNLEGNDYECSYSHFPAVLLTGLWIGMAVLSKRATIDITGGDIHTSDDYDIGRIAECSGFRDVIRREASLPGLRCVTLPSTPGLGCS